MTHNHQRIDDAVPRRRRGAQPGNQNALRHGQRSGATVIARKVTTARVKALLHVVHAYGLAVDPARYRISPLRPDQVELLSRRDPQLLALVPPGYVGPNEPPGTDREHD